MKTKAKTNPAIIAEILLNTPVRERGLLLKQVAAIMRNDGCGSTARILEAAGVSVDYTVGPSS
jgi:hypothetical protein